MIDENKLIEEIESMVRPLLTPDGTAYFDDAIQAHNETIVDVLNAIEQQPKVGEWIPVEEGLPEENEYVDITVLYKDEDTEYQYDTDVSRYRYYCQMWIDCHGVPIIGDVIAWKPRSEPYRKEDNK